MAIAPSNLRQNLYRLLDQVLKTGVPIEIKRKGHILRIVLDEKPDVFKNLKKHPDVLNCDPEEIVHLDWSSHWKYDLP